MTIDEAIQIENNIAEENQKIVDTQIVFDGVYISQLYCDDTEVIEEHLENYKKCVEYHEQIAEWLEELKAFREIFLKHLQDSDIATSFVISTYKKDLEILSCIDFTKIIDAVGVDAEQALEDCVSAMELFLPILEAVNILSKDNEQE